MSIWRAQEDQITSVTGCDWPLAWPDDGCPALTGLDPDQRELVEKAAWQMLWAWTGRRFGLCTVTIRPCRAESLTYARPSTFDGRGGTAITRHRPSGIVCGCPVGACKHSGVLLPGPVDSVDQITLDGTVMDPDGYTILGGVLVRDDGTGEDWPTRQDLLAPTTAEDTWEVVYTRGVPVPAGGQLAAGRLACELAKAYSNDKTCRLPARLQNVSRQGVTAGVLDPFEVTDQVKTGIWTIDSWVESTQVRTPRAVVSTPENTVRR